MRPKNIGRSGFGARQELLTFSGCLEIDAGIGRQAKKARAGSPLGGRLRALRKRSSGIVTAKVTSRHSAALHQEKTCFFADSHDLWTAAISVDTIVGSNSLHFTNHKSPVIVGGRGIGPRLEAS